MKIKKSNKNQVHPFSDFLSVLQLLPAAIFALTSLLSLDDREVLAYMITRSLKTPTTTATPTKKNHNFHFQHIDKREALFDCDCFQCYLSYWFRWDSSPNRELIHQAIEAFEEHLANGEKKQKKQSKKKNNKGRKREKVGEQVDKKAVVFVHEVVKDNIGSPEKGDVAAEEVVEAPAARGSCSHKGLARKVLPDVLGIFSSRLWSLWGPNV